MAWGSFWQGSSSCSAVRCSRPRVTWVESSTTLGCTHATLGLSPCESVTTSDAEVAALDPPARVANPIAPRRRTSSRAAMAYSVPAASWMCQLLGESSHAARRAPRQTKSASLSCPSALPRACCSSSCRTNTMASDRRASTLSSLAPWSRTSSHSTSSSKSCICRLPMVVTMPPSVTGSRTRGLISNWLE